MRARLAVVAAACGVTAAALRTFGQPLRCAQGDGSLWSSAVNSAHNSQHFADPYAFTHLLHGILLYAALHAVVGDRWSMTRRFGVAMGLEALWEVFENTPFIIERYRAGTISLDYYGDSILNSIGDLLACAAGFGVAAVVPVLGSVGLVVAVELLLLIWIRDSLSLNVVMLLWPIEWIRDWQLGPGA